MKTIVHITCDYPDPLVPAKTRAVANLVESTPQFRHVIYSLNRVSWKSSIVAVRFGKDRTAVAYGAPPKGIFLASRLEQVAEWIERDLRETGVSPDVFHACKLTVEGIISLELGRRFNRPFICNIWGDSDMKISSGRPDLAPTWRKILDHAAAVIPCAPWAADLFEAKYGLDPAKSTILAPIIKHDAFHASPPSPAPRLVSLFNLNSYERKNFAGLVGAIKAAAIPGLTLDLFGVGSPAAMIAVTEIVRRAGVEDSVKIKGPLGEGNFQDTLGAYSAFVMPSKRETFGMVFVEAMFAGLPIMNTRGWGVDGFFAPGEVGYAWNGRDEADIADGIRYLLREEKRLKQNIADLHAAGRLDQFKTANIAHSYVELLDRAVAGTA